MHRNLITALLLILALLPVSLQAQPFRHLDMAFEPVHYSTLESWLGRADALREAILVGSGQWPLSKRTPPVARITGSTQGPGYTVQNVVIETLPGLYLTGNLYRPVEGKGPFPAVLTAHGHWTHGRLENTETASIPGRSINLARQGYVVFAYSMIGYNENSGLIAHRWADQRYQLWGFTVAGLQLWNSLRAMDFLAGQKDVDAARIGMTGASGGGTQTFLLTAVDPRVAAAAPVNMISLIMQGGCVCENPPLARISAQNVDIGGLAAPRPLLMVSTSGDWTRNTPRSEYPAMQEIYNLFGAREKVFNVHMDYPHNYNRDSREAMYAWFGKWLRNDPSAPRETAIGNIDTTKFLAVLPGKPASPGKLFTDWQQEKQGQRAANMPANWNGLQLYRDTYGRALEHVLETGQKEDVNVQVRVPSGRTGTLDGVLLVHDGSTSVNQVAESLLSSGRLVFLFDPGKGGTVPPDSLAHWITYNPTPASRRVARIRVAAEQILERPDLRHLDLIAVGTRGPETLLARAYLPTVRNTRIDLTGFDLDSDKAFLDRLFIPSLRFAGDLRTAAALIAPARLEISGAGSAEFREEVRQFYRAAGALDRLTIR